MCQAGQRQRLAPGPGEGAAARPLHVGHEPRGTPLCGVPQREGPQLSARGPGLAAAAAGDGVEGAQGALAQHRRGLAVGRQPQGFGLDEPLHLVAAQLVAPHLAPHVAAQQHLTVGRQGLAAPRLALPAPVALGRPPAQVVHQVGPPGGREQQPAPISRQVHVPQLAGRTQRAGLFERRQRPGLQPALRGVGHQPTRGGHQSAHRRPGRDPRRAHCAHCGRGATRAVRGRLAAGRRLPGPRRGVRHRGGRPPRWRTSRWRRGPRPRAGRFRRRGRTAQQPQNRQHRKRRQPPNRSQTTHAAKVAARSEARKRPRVPRPFYRAAVAARLTPVGHSGGTGSGTPRGTGTSRSSMPRRSAMSNTRGSR